MPHKVALVREGAVVGEDGGDGMVGRVDAEARGEGFVEGFREGVGEGFGGRFRSDRGLGLGCVELGAEARWVLAQALDEAGKEAHQIQKASEADRVTLALHQVEPARVAEPSAGECRCIWHIMSPRGSIQPMYATCSPPCIR